MFIECKACDGSGEGVYGHSWTPCPVCHGAGQIAVPMPITVLSFEKGATITLCACPDRRVVETIPTSEDVDPTGVFPDESYKKRHLIAA